MTFDTAQTSLDMKSRKPLGRVTAINGSQATITIEAGVATPGDADVTVGRFMGILNGDALVIGLVTEVTEEQTFPQPAVFRRIARLDLIGEIRASANKQFQRGVAEYPMLGEPAVLLEERELRLIYGGADKDRAHIGDLQQDNTIAVNVHIDDLVSKHFAILGTTGVGKSSSVAIILNEILNTRPNLRIFLVDPHNEYSPCFGDKAQVLTPRNLRLPFWLFNFEEVIDAFFGGRPGVDEEVEILSEVIPLAKAAYLQYRNTANERALTKKRSDPRDVGFTADTPVPYRIEDLINLLDERMGKLENRSQRVTIHRLMSRIQTFRNHPRYAFMFEGANIGGDTMAEIIGGLFRLPIDNKPMTIMQLAGFPAEVVDSVVSVLCRMAFDFGLWSDGVSPLLFVCEEAHRYAPADKKIGFGPTRRALSRIAKEGRKYGVFLGLVTQRPAEIDPTIISQCSTLFVMRLANDRDQALIRSAVSDAAANFLSFIPSLGTREVFAFGAGVALPTRMRFKELALAQRPNSEAGASTRDIPGSSLDRDLIGNVIERWRSSTMSHKVAIDDDFASPLDQMASAPPLQPTPVAPPPVAAPSAQPAQAFDPNRARLLKRPLDHAGMPIPPGPNSPAPPPSRPAFVSPAPVRPAAPPPGYPPPRPR